MANRSHTLFPLLGSMEQGIERIYGQILTTTNGTIDTTAASSSATVGIVTRSKCGVTQVKTAGKTGRYTITLDGPIVQVLAWGATVEGTADAAVTAGRATTFQMRALDETVASFFLQCLRSDTQADAEVEDVATIRWWLDVRLSRARDAY